MAEEMTECQATWQQTADLHKYKHSQSPLTHADVHMSLHRQMCVRQIVLEPVQGVHSPSMAEATTMLRHRRMKRRSLVDTEKKLRLAETKLQGKHVERKLLQRKYIR